MVIVVFPADPAISSLQHNFVRADCRTVRGGYREGKQSCDWSSCREGCTHEVSMSYLVSLLFLTSPVIPSDAGLQLLADRN